MVETTIDWRKAAAELSRDVQQHGGFLTIQRDALRRLFGIGRLTEGICDNLTEILKEHELMAWPPPYWDEGKTLRVYDVQSDIGRIACSIVDPHKNSERALADAVNLQARANAGKDRRSDDVPWLVALDVFLQLVIGRPPDNWEDLVDDREPYQLVSALADSLGLPAEVADAKATIRVAAAVCASRPRAFHWEGAPPGLDTALAEAARKQKETFDRVLAEAAKHLLDGADIPKHNVELGRLGLRYRREATGGIGWLR